MKTSEYKVPIHLPTVDEFIAVYPHYSRAVRGPDRFLFDLVMTPEAAATAILLTRLGRAAVEAVLLPLRLTFEVRGATPTPRQRQLVGALVCHLMEANGHLRERNVKRRIASPFTVGQLFRPAEGRRPLAVTAP